MSSSGQFDTTKLSALFDVEHRLRRASSTEELRYITVNESHRVVDYQQAAIVETSGGSGWQVSALANVPSVDRNSLYVQWIEHIASIKPPQGNEPYALQEAGLDEWACDTWREISPGQVLLVPLDTDDEPTTWLWLARENVWHAAEINLAAHVSEVSGHALRSFTRTRQRRRWRSMLASKRLWLIALALIALVLCIPVKLSALAPAEIVAEDPFVVAAPMDGVVDRVLVDPNAYVKQGQPLVELQDIEAQARFQVASQSLKVAQARYNQAMQESFSDADSRASLAALKAERDLREIKKDYASQQLEKVVLKAENAGLAIFDDPNDWDGRPVRTGERIMQLADPDKRKVRVDLPVDDALVLEAGAPVTLFLDSRPLSPVEGKVTRVAYQPVVNDRNQLVYHVSARLDESPDFLRIGLRGTARISGDRVPLAYYLFRRPIAGLRQTLGI